jgi:rhodanese-related sulfurtransferase
METPEDKKLRLTNLILDNKDGKSVFNLSQPFATIVGPFDPNQWVWISISDPDYPITNPDLEKLNHIKLEFYDLEYPVDDLAWSGRILCPITPTQIEQLYEFIWINQNKSILVNCAMGVSRSGAVAKFCETFFSYTWPEWFKSKSNFNKFIFNELMDFHDNYPQV